MYQVQCNGKSVGQPHKTRGAAESQVQAEWSKRLKPGGGGVPAGTEWEVVDLSETK